MVAQRYASIAAIAMSPNTVTGRGSIGHPLKRGASVRGRNTGDSLPRLEKRKTMSKLLCTVVASGVAFALNAAIAQTEESPVKQQTPHYSAINGRCMSMEGPARERCLKGFTPSFVDAGCETLTDRDKRECMLDTFIKKHDGVTSGAQVRNSDVTEPVAPPLR